MGLTKGGVEFIARQIVQPGTSFDFDNAYIGVGNGTAIFEDTQTDLQGALRARHGMDAGYPIVTGSTIVLRTTFPTTEANFTWNEWGVFNAETGGVMLSRFVEYNSTKLSNQEWVMEVTLELSATS